MNQLENQRGLIRGAIFALAFGIALAASPAANADEWLDRLNTLAEPAPGEQDGTAILFDAVARMDPLPQSVADAEAAREAIPGDRAWSALSSWASAAPQQAVLKAVATITERRDRYILGLPYTAANAPSNWQDAGLVVTLPESGLLIEMQLDYLAPLREVFALHWVEMVRQAEAGEEEKSIDAMQHAVRLARMLLERPTADEVTFATDMMLKSLEKILDTCRTLPETFSATDFAEINRRLEERRILLDRQELPMGDKEIAGQLVARGIEERRAAEGPRLAQLMSGVSANPNQRPLERFSRAAQWQTIAEQHADWFDTTDELDDLFGDWNTRWALPDIKDPLLKRLSDYRKMDKRRFLILEEALKDYERIFDQRIHLYTAMHGTTSAVAVLGFKARGDRFPPELPAVQPTFVQQLGADPYSILSIYRAIQQNTRAFQRWEKHAAFKYFVPIRDQNFDRREEPQPYEVLIQLKGGASADAVKVVDPEMYALGAQIFSTEIKIIREKLRGADLPEGAFDPATGEYDLDSLRTFLVGWLDDYEVTSDEARQFQQGFEIFKAIPNFDISQMQAGVGSPEFMNAVREGLRAEVMASGASESVMDDDDAWREALGITFDEYLQVFAMYLRSLYSSPEAARLIEKVVGGDYLTREDVRLMLVSAVEESMTDQFMSEFMPFATRVYNSPVGEAIFTGHEVSTDSFAVELDDSTFILYSVGPDEVDNDAKNVYPPGVENMRSGTDVLIYPPALSLKREQGGF